MLKNEHLRQVLDSVDVTYVARDNREALEQKIISHWSRTGGEGWALLVFGGGSPPVSLNMPPNTPFFIGSDPVKCNPGKVVKDEWVNPGGQRGSRVSSAHCDICIPG